MTKSHGRGENEFTDAARRESARTGRPVCDIPRAWRREAERDGDTARTGRLRQAEKLAGCRNRRKRGA